MIRKGLLFIILCLVSAFAFSQTTVTANTLNATTRIQLKNRKFDTLSIDGTFGANADDVIPSQKAIKTYVTNAIATQIFPNSYYKNGLHARNDSTAVLGTGSGTMDSSIVIDGNSAFPFTFANFPAASGRGFRVNFGSDAGWDLFTRDSATGFWTRIPKGSVGQSLQMLGSGGIGFAAQSGGGGSSLTRQSITSGVSGTVIGGNYIVTFDFASLAASYALTLPAAPSDLQVVEIETGNTIVAPGPEVTSFSILPNSGQSINQASAPTTLNSGEYIKYRYHATGTFWNREN